MSDDSPFFFYEGLKGAANGQDSWGFFRDARGFGRLDAGSRAGFISSRPPPPRTSVFQFCFFCCTCVALRKFDLLIKLIGAEFIRFVAENAGRG